MLFRKDNFRPPRLVLLDILLPSFCVGDSEDGVDIGVGFARSSHRAKKCIGLLSNTVLLLSIDSILIVLFQHHDDPFDS